MMPETSKMKVAIFRDDSCCRGPYKYAVLLGNCADADVSEQPNSSNLASAVQPGLPQGLPGLCDVHEKGFWVMCGERAGVLLPRWPGL